MKALAVGLVALVAAVAAPATLASNYVVLYKQQAVPAGAAAAVQKAGGTVVAAYPQIGVVIASSTSDTFRAALLNDTRIENAAATAGFAVKLRDTESASTDSGPPETQPNAPATDSDSLSPLQWDMRQIKAP